MFPHRLESIDMEIRKPNNTPHGSRILLLVVCFFLSACSLPTHADAVVLPSPDSPEGYVCQLLINEVPFPGERAYVSEENTKAAMEQLLHVLDNRLRSIPAPYSQKQIASTRTDNIIDIITAGGEKGQFDGFYRDHAGKPATVPRVRERIDNLVKISNQGEPGRFARLLQHARDTAVNYIEDTSPSVDRYAHVKRAENIDATGGGFGWMTDEVRYNPGGSYLRISDHDSGSLGGNRFYTLRKVPK